ncbi:hypothetical protein F4680DRAFT_6828 [Xylaria scruposa]|nr:hypothetical protein F4680DRAFT_6828 [Xylaria scruposa]
MIVKKFFILCMCFFCFCFVGYLPFVLYLYNLMCAPMDGEHYRWMGNVGDLCNLRAIRQFCLHIFRYFSFGFSLLTFFVGVCVRAYLLDLFKKALREFWSRFLDWTI